MGAGPLARQKNSEQRKGKQPVGTSAQKGSKVVVSDPELISYSNGAVAGRVVTGLPLRTGAATSKSPQQQSSAMAGKDDVFGEVVHTIIVMGASVRASYRHKRKRAGNFESVEGLKQLLQIKFWC